MASQQGKDNVVVRHAFITLRNYSVRAGGNWVATIEAPNWDVAVARVPIITRLVEGGIPRPIVVCEHRGMVCTLWFSDAWFRNLQVSDREFDFEQRS